jgi:hypothetical protein
LIELGFSCSVLRSLPESHPRRIIDASISMNNRVSIVLTSVPVVFSAEQAPLDRDRPQYKYAGADRDCDKKCCSGA